MVERSTAGYGEGPDWADRGAGGTALRSPENGMGVDGGEGGGGGEERKAGRAREDTERTSLGPEDRPSKLSHALSVLRKRRIGVVLRCCFQEEGGRVGGGGGRVRERG